MKTRIKIALISGLVTIATIILFGGAMYYFLNKYSYVDFFERLETRARISAQYYLAPRSSDTERLKALKEQHLEKLEKEKEYLIELNDKVYAVSENYRLSSDFITELIEKGKASEKRQSVFYTGIKFQKNNKDYLVIVSAENYYTSHHLIFFRNILLGGVLLTIIIMAFFSVYFSKYVFGPIKEITDRVKLISTEKIHLRLDNNYGNNNEIYELINTFNDLLNRIETSFETQKNFIGNASHELGTPLTAIIGEADVCLLKPRKPEEYQVVLKNILHHAERLDQITKSLLFLAQTGYKGKAIVFEMVRVDEVLWDTKALIDRLNPENKITIDLNLLPEDPVKLKVKGNKQLLQLAIANILSNGCKYSNNKEVIVYIASSDSQLILTIKDQGIGIPEFEMAYIYDPFFRASNTSSFAGYGIGLPLARNVVTLHKGTMSVTSKVNVGTVVQIKLPLMFSNL